MTLNNTRVVIPLALKMIFPDTVMASFFPAKKK